MQNFNICSTDPNSGLWTLYFLHLSCSNHFIKVKYENWKYGKLQEIFKCTKVSQAHIFWCIDTKQALKSEALKLWMIKNKNKTND